MSLVQKIYFLLLDKGGIFINKEPPPPPSTRELDLLQKMAECSAYMKPYLNCIIEAQIDFSFRKLDYSFYRAILFIFTHE